MKASSAILTALSLLLLVGCSSRRTGFHRDQDEVGKLRPRLALLRAGMSPEEVSTTLGVKLFPSGGSVNWFYYYYPGPFDPKHQFELSCCFTNDAFQHATLNLYET
jgi:hypothetical protein